MARVLYHTFLNAPGMKNTIIGYWEAEIEAVTNDSFTVPPLKDTGNTAVQVIDNATITVVPATSTTLDIDSGVVGNVEKFVTIHTAGPNDLS